MSQSFPNFNVVLVRTIYSRNLGSVARVMANMGAGRLILIDPQCEINLEARQGAAGAQSHLLHRTVYKNWWDFYKNENEGVRIAFCGKFKQQTDKLDFEKRINSILRKKNCSNLYFIFGPEDDGLCNDDLEFVHFISKLPTFGKFESMNISHAVLLALYIAKTSKNYVPLKNQNIEVEKIYFPQNALTEWLETLGFKLNGRKRDAYQVLKKVLLQNLSSADDLRVLESIVFQTVRKLKLAKKIDS